MANYLISFPSAAMQELRVFGLDPQS